MKVIVLDIQIFTTCFPKNANASILTTYKQEIGICKYKL